MLREPPSANMGQTIAECDCATPEECAAAGRCRAVGTRERDIDAALETASACRHDASVYRQLGFFALATWLLENAKAAERWATKR